MNRKFLSLLNPIFAVVLLLVVGTRPTAPAHAIFCSSTNSVQRVSLTTLGTETFGSSNYPSMSTDGRYVGFDSDGALVPGDGNNVRDIYVFDRQTCGLQLVSVSTTGEKGNADSYSTKLSGDGRYVTFESDASNLVAGDTNGQTDVFLHDRQTGITTRVSVATGGTQANNLSNEAAISSDGRFIAFQSWATNLTAGDTNGNVDIFVHNRVTGNTARVSLTNAGGQPTGGNSRSSALSSDGRYVVFESEATNLVTGDTNSQPDIFVRDRQANTTTRISVATGGAQADNSSDDAAISADGNLITFISFATNLVAGDTNGFDDIFLHDRTAATTTRVSVATGGTQTIDGGGYSTDISDDGRYIVFESDATNLVPNDTNGSNDIFVHDRTTTTTTRVSLGLLGQANDDTSLPSISGDARYISFESNASNLVGGDANSTLDVFATPRLLPADDTLALFNPAFEQVNLLDTLADNPATSAHTIFSAYAPPTTAGQWVMGDWNGDGLKTPGVYANGPFYYTNKLGETLNTDWRSLWIGITGTPVSGQFDDALSNDCIGAVQSANFPPFGTAFVLYYTCDLSGNAAPTISNQWLSIVLPDSGGFTGTHQFAAGDFDDDGDDSIAVRRGTTIAFGNVAPVDGSAAFDLAQYIGAPGTSSDGIFVSGDWNADGTDSFGLFYQNGEFYYRNDLLFNSGTYVNQSVGTPFGNAGVQATTWR